MKIVYVTVAMVIVILSFSKPVPSAESEREHSQSEHHRHDRRELGSDRTDHGHEQKGRRHEGRHDRPEASRHEDDRRNEPRHRSGKTRCMPAKWIAKEGYASKQRLLLSVFGSPDGEERCTNKCLRYSSCATVDTRVKGRQTSCYASNDLGDLETAKDFVHWEYVMECQTSEGKGQLFQYLGNYTVRPKSGTTTRHHAHSLQHCLRLCAEQASCRVLFYTGDSCYHVTSLTAARRVKMIQHDASAFLKKVRQSKRHASTNHTQVKADYCISQKHGKSGISSRSLVCWSRKANQRCALLYVGEYRLTNRTLVTEADTVNRTACLLKCTETAKCDVVSYRDQLCQMVVQRGRGMPAKLQSRHWAMYSKKDCRSSSAASTHRTAYYAVRAILWLVVVAAGLLVF